jgi:hypothetical protein
LTSCCGLDVHYPTSALKSVKDPCNTFKLNSMWARTLPSLIYFTWDIYRGSTFTICFQISKLIFDTLLWAWGALFHLGT